MVDLEIEVFPTQTLPIPSSSISLAMGVSAHLIKPTLLSPCHFQIVDSKLGGGGSIDAETGIYRRKW